jgi:hypothetical protein
MLGHCSVQVKTSDSNNAAALMLRDPGVGRTTLRARRELYLKEKLQRQLDQPRWLGLQNLIERR